MPDNVDHGARHTRRGDPRRPRLEPHLDKIPRTPVSFPLPPSLPLLELLTEDGCRGRPYSSRFLRTKRAGVWASTFSSLLLLLSVFCIFDCLLGFPADRTAAIVERGEDGRGEGGAIVPETRAVRQGLRGAQTDQAPSTCAKAPVRIILGRGRGGPAGESRNEHMRFYPKASGLRCDDALDQLHEQPPNAQDGDIGLRA